MGVVFAVVLIMMIFYFKGCNVDIGGKSATREGSIFFSTFVILQFWNMFNAKAFASGKSAFHGLNKSIGFLIVAFVILVGQILIVEFGGEVFRTVPLTLKDWAVIIGSTSFVLWIGEIIRAIKR